MARGWGATNREDPDVYVSQTQDSPTVYHTQEDCSRMPVAYWTMAESLANERGLRECTVCMNERLSHLEL